jgi:hypothetical protein
MMRPFFRVLAKARLTPDRRIRRLSWGPGRYLVVGRDGSFRAESREGDGGKVHVLSREEVLATDWKCEARETYVKRMKFARPKVEA